MTFNKKLIIKVFIVLTAIVLTFVSFRAQKLSCFVGDETSICYKKRLIDFSIVGEEVYGRFYSSLASDGVDANVEYSSKVIDSYGLIEANQKMKESFGWLSANSVFGVIELEDEGAILLSEGSEHGVLYFDKATEKVVVRETLDKFLPIDDGWVNKEFIYIDKVEVFNFHNENSCEFTSDIIDLKLRKLSNGNCQFRKFIYENIDGVWNVQLKSPNANKSSFEVYGTALFIRNYLNGFKSGN